MTEYGVEHMADELRACRAEILRLREVIARQGEALDTLRQFYRDAS